MVIIQIQKTAGHKNIFEIKTMGSCRIRVDSLRSKGQRSQRNSALDMNKEDVRRQQNV